MGYSLVLSTHCSRSGSNEHGTRRPRNQGWRPWDNPVPLLHLDNKGPCPGPWVGPFLAETLTWIERFTELRGSPPSIIRAHGSVPRPQNSMIKLSRATASLFSSFVLYKVPSAINSTSLGHKMSRGGCYRRRSWRPLAVQIEKGAGFPVTCNVTFGNSQKISLGEITFALATRRPQTVSYFWPPPLPYSISATAQSWNFINSFPWKTSFYSVFSFLFIN